MAISADGTVAKQDDVAKAVASGVGSVGFPIHRDQIPGVIADRKHAPGSLGWAKDAG